METIMSFRKNFTGIVSILLLSAFASTTARAQTTLLEDFESGTLTNWIITPALTTLDISTFTNKIPGGGTYSALQDISTDSMFMSGLTNIFVTQTNEFGVNTNALGITNMSFKFTYYFYNQSQTRGGAEVRTYENGSYGDGGLSQLIFMGQNNNISVPLFSVANGFPSDEVFDGTKYQARLAFGTPAGYFNLNNPGTPSRSAQWHKFAVELGTNILGQGVYNFFVDDVLGRQVTNSSTVSWNAISMGFPRGGSTVGNCYYDGYEITQGQPFFAGDPEVTTTNTVGETTNIFVTAYGEASALAFQWRRNGTSLTDGGSVAGAMTSSLTLSTLQVTDSGSYTVVITNIAGVKTSTVSYLQVNGPLLVTMDPTNLIVNPDQTATFYGGAISSSGNLGYRWQKNGANMANGGSISGADTETLVISPADYPDAASYSFIATNLIDPPVTSAVAVLTVNTNPVFGTISTQLITLGGTFGFLVPVSDDVSQLATPFQTFETNSVGTRVMFCRPDFSGTTALYLPTNTALNFTYITNVYPSDVTNGHGSKVLMARWTFHTNSPPGYLRLTTSSGGVTPGPNPVIYYTLNFSTHVRFDMFTDTDLNVALMLHETNPTGAIGSNGGTVGQIEFFGVSAGGTPPVPTRTVASNTWTTLDFDIPTEPLVSALGLGNSALNSTTDKGTLGSLILVPTDGANASNTTFNIYLDNFVSTPPNALQFSLASEPAGMTIDPYSGFVSWTPTNVGVFTFSAIATDYLGLSSTNSYTIKVAIPAISIALVGSDSILTWSAGPYYLQSNTNPITGTWVYVPGPVTTSPYTNTISQFERYFRLTNVTP